MCHIVNVLQSRSKYFVTKIFQTISTRLARHHLQRFSASDAAASTLWMFCFLNCYCCGTIQTMFDMHSDFQFALFLCQYEGCKCRTGSSISSRISRHINIKLTLSIVFVSHIDIHFMPNYPKPRHLKNQLFLLFLLFYTAWIFLSLPLSP